MKALLQLFVVLILAVSGVAAFAYGELHDAPGLMLLGVLTVASATWLAVKIARTARQRT